MRTRFTAIVASFLALALLLTGCAGASADTAGTTAATTAAAATTTAGTTAATTAASGTTTAAATTATTLPPTANATELSIFMQEGGGSLPEDFDHADNWLLDYVQEQANIVFTEVICPPYVDTQTRFDLLMASGDITDFVFRADLVAMKDYGEKGAFLPTEDIIRGNDFLASRYNDAQIDTMRSSDGVAYIILNPPLNDDFSAMGGRLDLMEKYGYTWEDFQSLEKLTDAARELKSDEPDSLPFTTFTTWGLNEFWATTSFNTGFSGWKYYPERDAYCSNWEGDNVVRLLEWTRDVYSEGLLDQEFLTNDIPAYGEKRKTRDTLCWSNNYLSVELEGMSLAANGASYVPINWPMAADVGIDQYTSWMNLTGGYAFGIKKGIPEDTLAGVIRFLKVLYSDEMADLTCYGREGIEYNVKNGKKLPTELMEGDYPNTLFDFCWVSVNNAAKIDYYGVKRLSILTGAGKTEAEALAIVSDIQTKAAKVKPLAQALGVDPTLTIAANSTEINDTINETTEYQESLCSKVILGQMTIDEFIAARDEFVAKYQYITDDYNARYAAIKG